MLASRTMRRIAPVVHGKALEYMAYPKHSPLWMGIRDVHETDECIVWSHCRQRGPHPYGQVNYRGKTQPVHRLSYMIHIGPIPTGRLVCHTCDNPPCFNPTHLFAATQKTNVADCIRKGRFKFRPKKPFGAARARSNTRILTPRQVREIRKLYRRGITGSGFRALARKFDVYPTTIQKIIDGDTWKNLP